MATHITEELSIFTKEQAYLLKQALSSKQHKPWKKPHMIPALQHKMDVGFSCSHHIESQHKTPGGREPGNCAGMCSGVQGRFRRQNHPLRQWRKRETSCEECMVGAVSGSLVTLTLASLNSSDSSSLQGADDSNCFFVFPIFLLRISLLFSMPPSHCKGL